MFQPWEECSVYMMGWAELTVGGRTVRSMKNKPSQIILIGSKVLTCSKLSAC